MSCIDVTSWPEEEEEEEEEGDLDGHLWGWNRPLTGLTSWAEEEGIRMFPLIYVLFHRDSQ